MVANRPPFYATSPGSSPENRQTPDFTNIHQLLLLHSADLGLLTNVKISKRLCFESWMACQWNSFLLLNSSDPESPKCRPGEWITNREIMAASSTAMSDAFWSVVEFVSLLSPYSLLLLLLSTIMMSCQSCIRLDRLRKGQATPFISPASVNFFCM